MSELLKKVEYVRFTKGGIVVLSLGLIACILVIPIPVIVISLVIFHVARRSQTLSIYQDRIEVRSKFITEKIRRIEASKIEAVDVTDTPLGQRGYGTLIITGSGGTKILATPVPHQHELAELVRGISGTSSKRVSSSSQDAGVTGDDLASQLHKIEELRAAGVLSEDEFKAAKAKLLGL